MKKVFIDEYLSVQLRERIDKLVELNLDFESILSLLSNDLYEYADYMLDEVQRYLKYLIWLRDHHKDRNLAFEKYKKQTKQEQKKPPVSSASPQQKNEPSPLTNELFLAQLRKERQRIDEISNLHYAKSQQEKAEQKEEQSVNDLQFEESSVDEILENLTDEEIQEVFDEVLTKNFNSLDQEETAETVESVDKKEPKKEEPILDEPTGDQNPKSLVETAKKIEDLTFDDILTDHSTPLLNSETSQTLFEFDYLEDNGTETLNDSILLEDEELNLQNFTTHQTLNPKNVSSNFEGKETEQQQEKEMVAEPILDQNKQSDEEDTQESISVQTDEIDSEDLSAVLEKEEFEMNQSEEAIADESEELILEETNQALNFLDQLEDKYGDQTLVTLNSENQVLETTNFTLAEPTSTLKIGVHVHYHHHDYIVENIEIELDFFRHQQTIVTLNDVENQNKIQINAKKIK